MMRNYLILFKLLLLRFVNTYVRAILRLSIKMHF